MLQRFGVCERGGMDEMLVDVTAEAQNRALQGSIPAQWAAHVHSNKVAVQLTAIRRVRTRLELQIHVLFCIQAPGLLAISEIP